MQPEKNTCTFIFHAPIQVHEITHFSPNSSAMDRQRGRELANKIDKEQIELQHYTALHTQITKQTN